MSPKHESENRLPIDILEAGIEFIKSQPEAIETDPEIIESLRNLGLYREPASPEDISYVTEIVSNVLPKVEVISNYIDGQTNPSHELLEQKSRYERAIDTSKNIIAISNEVNVEKVDETTEPASSQDPVTTPTQEATSTSTTGTELTKQGVSKSESKAAVVNPLISKVTQKRIAKIILDTSDRNSRIELLKLFKEDIESVRSKKAERIELTANESKALSLRNTVDKAFKHVLRSSDDGIVRLSEIVDAIFDEDTRKELTSMRRIKEFIGIHVFDRSRDFATKANIVVKVGEEPSRSSTPANPRIAYLYAITDEYATLLGVQQKYKGELPKSVITNSTNDTTSEVAQPPVATQLDEVSDTLETVTNTDAVSDPTESDKDAQMSLECFLTETVFDQLAKYDAIKFPPMGMHSVSSYFELIVKSQKSIEGRDGTMINLQKTRMDALTVATFETIKILTDIAEIDGNILELDQEFFEIISNRLFDQDDKGSAFKTDFTFTLICHMIKSSKQFNIDIDTSSKFVLVEKVANKNPKTVEPISSAKTSTDTPAATPELRIPLYSDEARDRLSRFITDIPTESKRFAQ